MIIFAKKNCQNVNSRFVVLSKLQSYTQFAIKYINAQQQQQELFSKYWLIETII